MKMAFHLFVLISWIFQLLEGISELQIRMSTPANLDGQLGRAGQREFSQRGTLSTR